jgi:hypothetical protein
LEFDHQRTPEDQDFASCELAMLPVAPLRKRRCLKPQNQAGDVQRLTVLTPNEVLWLKQSIPLWFMIQELTIVTTCMGMIVTGFYETADGLLQEIDLTLTYDPRSIVPGYLAPRMETIDDAFTYYGTAEFKHSFGASREELKTIALHVIGNHRFVSPPSAKKGTIGGEEAILLLMARLRHVASTMCEVGKLLGVRSKGYASCFGKMVIDYIYQRWRHLLELQNMTRFREYLDLWEDAVMGAYSRSIGFQTALPDYTDGANVFLDCLRMCIARPSEGQRAFYNGWLGCHSITRVVITEPGGLFVGVGNGLAGHRE